MTDSDWISEQFEKNRAHLTRVALRMLGSRSEADDALQEAWVRIDRFGAGGVDNVGAWLTSVVARVCLDLLRWRASRREVSEANAQHEALPPAVSGEPEADVLLADSIGAAMLVVLETLGPAERVAFVLHDLFDMTFDEIAPILGRSAAATRQLASRARRRVRGGPAAVAADAARHRNIVGAFLRASRDGDLASLLAVLAPDVVLRADEPARRMAAAAKWADLPEERRGADAVAETLRGRARGVRPALVDGAPGAAIAVHGETKAVWLFVIEGDAIVEIELVMDADRLGQLEVTFEP